MRDKFEVLQSVERSVANRQYDKAIREYQKLLKNEGEDPFILNTLGDLLLKSDRQGEALEHFSRVGEIFVQSGFISKAIAIYKKIRAIDSSNVTATESLVDLLERRGAGVDIIGPFRDLIEAYRSSGDFASAISCQRRLADVTPGRPETYLEWAQLLAEANQPDEAGERYLQAARVFFGKDLLPEAQDAALKAEELSPEAEGVRSLIGQIREGMQQSEAEGLPVAPPSSSDTPLTDPPQPEQEPVTIEEIPVAANPLPPVDPPPVSEPLPRDHAETLMQEEGRDEPGIILGSDEEVVIDRGSELGRPQSPSTDGNWEIPVEEPAEMIGSSGPALAQGSRIVGLESNAVEAGTTSDRVEELLQEVDFYLKLELHDDAERVLRELVELYPDDERVLLRAREVGMDVSPPIPVPPRQESELDGEIESALDGMFGEAMEDGTEEALIYEVGKDGESSLDDRRSKYDLGLAYREMGMHDDAAEKFEEAIEIAESEADIEQAVLCATMLSATYLQLNNFKQVIAWADRGLAFPEVREFERKALRYDKAHAMEMLGEFDESLGLYRQIFDEDADFRDVQARIARIDLLST